MAEQPGFKPLKFTFLVTPLYYFTTTQWGGAHSPCGSPSTGGEIEAQSGLPKANQLTSRTKSQVQSLFSLQSPPIPFTVHTNAASKSCWPRKTHKRPAFDMTWPSSNRGDFSRSHSTSECWRLWGHKLSDLVFHWPRVLKGLSCIRSTSEVNSSASRVEIGLPQLSGEAVCLKAQVNLQRGQHLPWGRVECCFFQALPL